VFVSVFILAFSCAALLYWARYSCLTIMRAGSVHEEAERVAVANQLEFQKIRSQIVEQSAETPAAYDRLRDALRHDFLALTYLLRYAATVEVGRYSREERMLIVDYHVMRLVYRLGRVFGPRTSRYALLEMSDVLEYFASVMNRRMMAFSANMVGA